ncbi:hypothetical protein KI387_025371, partial [Taxus chinensis]
DWRRRRKAQKYARERQGRKRNACSKKEGKLAKDKYGSKARASNCRDRKKMGVREFS